MAALADITVYDGASTPIAHYFIADHVEYDGANLTALWQEKTAGIPEYAQGSCLLSKKKVGSGMTRVGFRVNLPVMESVSGQNLSGYTAAPKVAYVDSGEVIQWVHPRSLYQGRLNCGTILRNLLSNVATSAAATTTGNMYAWFTQLVMPS